MKWLVVSLWASLFVAQIAWAFGFEVKSIEDNKPMDVKYTCQGKNISPAIAWHKVPKNTQSLALVMTDKDAPSGSWVHWIVINLDPNIEMLLSEVANLPSSATQIPNSWQRPRYDGPCPPSGTHHYEFTLYALGQRLVPTGIHNIDDLHKVMDSHILDSRKVIGIYTKTNGDLSSANKSSYFTFGWTRFSNLFSHSAE